MARKKAKQRLTVKMPYSSVKPFSKKIKEPLFPKDKKDIFAVIGDTTKDRYKNPLFLYSLIENGILPAIKKGQFSKTDLEKIRNLILDHLDSIKNFNLGFAGSPEFHKNPETHLRLIRDWLRQNVEQVPEHTSLKHNKSKNQGVPTLNKEELKVLNYLAEQFPQIKYQEDIVGAMTITRRTLGQTILPTLKKSGLARVPENRKYGIVITDKGKDYIENYFS